jgi:hypothetical protein
MAAFKIKTSPTQRDIIVVALTHQKKLAQDGISMLKRLGKGEGPALEASGAVEYLQDEFARMNIGERDVKNWDITRVGALQLKAALLNWARQALARSESAAQLTLTTNVTAQEKSAQDLLDQLHDQLSLPLIGFSELIEQQDARAFKRTPKDGSEEKEPDDTSGTSPAPHRGKQAKPAAKK